nr:hypothetical protein [Tanacetum cinerariifolium]
MVMIVHHSSRLSISRNRATIKTMVMIIIHKIHRVVHNNIFAVKTSFYDDDDDDDYEEITNPLPLSILITTSPSVLPIEDPEVSLIMGDEDLNTIPEKESDEVMKSSVEDLVLIPSKSEDTSGSDSECIFTFVDDESLFDEDVSKDNVKIYSNPLFEFDDKYISSDPTLLVTPLAEANEDECFAPGGDVDEIELQLHHDPSNLKMSVASILERFTEEPPLKKNDDLFDLESKENKWKKILYDAPINDLMTEDKVLNPGISEKLFSPTYMSLPFKDRHYLFFTYVIRTHLSGGLG